MTAAAAPVCAATGETLQTVEGRQLVVYCGEAPVQGRRLIAYCGEGVRPEWQDVQQVNALQPAA